MHWSDLFNSGASLFIVATASTKTMVPLRILAIVTNCALVAFYAASHAWLPLLFQGFALPLNGYRLYQMMVLIGNVREAIRGHASMDWLKPFMSERHCRKGDILFAKGELADEMFCTVSGRYLLVELGIELEPAQVVGELGFLAPDNRRTATLECIEAGKVLAITYEQVEQLYYQNPTFGFYFLRLSTERLFDNIRKLEDELEASMKPRCSPLCSSIGSRPRAVSSRRLPQLDFSGPDTVPEPIRSPVARLQPLEGVEMRDHLRERPVGGRERSLRQPLWRHPSAPHGVGRQIGL